MSLLWADSSELLSSNPINLPELDVELITFCLHMLFPPQMGIRSLPRYFAVMEYGKYIPLKRTGSCLIVLCVKTMYTDLDLSKHTINLHGLLPELLNNCICKKCSYLTGNISLVGTLLG
jgi:hypothetical protein